MSAVPDATPTHLLWALTLGVISAVSLPLGSLVGLNVRVELRQIALFAAFGAGALIAADGDARRHLPARGCPQRKPSWSSPRGCASGSWEA